MKLAVTMELYAYWSRLRGTRSAPERNDVDPGAIRGVLADTFVLDFDESAGFPMRIVGTRANALFLKELRGVSFLDLWRAEDRDDVCSILHSVADGAQPFLLGAQARPAGFPPSEVETMLLPLRHHGQTHARILGCSALKGSPTWFGLVAAGPLALVSLRALGHGAARALERASDAAAFAAPAPPPPARRGHLLVYSGEQRAK